MSRFLDGPAISKTLDCARAPTFIRVVVAASGKIDVLDLMDDTPRSDEMVHVYEQVPGTHHGPMFVCVRGRGGGSGRFESADYVYRPDIDGEQLRDNGSWRAWAQAQPSAIGPVAHRHPCPASGCPGVECFTSLEGCGDGTRDGDCPMEHRRGEACPDGAQP